jgi:hypothetical protein
MNRELNNLENSWSNLKNKVMKKRGRKPEIRKILNNKNNLNNIAEKDNFKSPLPLSSI